MYTDVLHAALIDKASHAYVVHLNEDAFLEARQPDYSDTRCSRWHHRNQI